MAVQCFDGDGKDPNETQEWDHDDLTAIISSGYLPEEYLRKHGGPFAMTLKGGVFLPSYSDSDGQMTWINVK